jgi:hypothetical protein
MQGIEEFSKTLLSVQDTIGLEIFVNCVLVAFDYPGEVEISENDVKLFASKYKHLTTNGELKFS